MSEHELRALLSRWAAIEPQRCRQRDDASFDVHYLGHWMTTTAHPASHGAIIAAVLGGCHDHQIYCGIDYTPRYGDQPATVEVGRIPKMFRWDQGEGVVASVPVLLLTEYLERLEGRSS